MNHMDKIAAQLPEYGLDAMLITSDSGERYALDFHGEGVLLIAREGARYITDGRYIEAARGAGDRRGGLPGHRGEGTYGAGQGVHPGAGAAQRGL